MIDGAALADFHFLRPLWLLLIVPALLAFFFVRRQSNPVRAWQGIIEAHLLDALVVKGGRNTWLQPIHLSTATLVLGSLVLAGPTWEREPTPFSQNTSPLVIVLDLSRSMNAVDVAPTRLERAKQKIRDLLELRGSARSALIAYAGSAHTVLPLTEDSTILERYLMALETELMPVAGKDPARALALAEQVLAREETPGSILFFTDGIDGDALPAFRTHRDAGLDPVLVLAVGTSEGGPIRLGEGRYATDASGAREMPRLDRAGLEALGREAGAFVATVTLDDRDVQRVQRRVEAHLVAAREEDASARWRDAGVLGLWPIAALSALWFRRGWTVRWW